MRTVTDMQTEGQEEQTGPADGAGSLITGNQRGSVKASYMTRFVFWKGHSSSKEGGLGRTGRMTSLLRDRLGLLHRQAALAVNPVLRLVSLLVKS